MPESGDRGIAVMRGGGHRHRHLLSGLLECGVCGGPYAMRGQDRYGCSNHVMTGACSNGRGIRRTVIEDGGYVRGMVSRLRELEARQNELNERLAGAPADLPNIHPNIADVYRRKVARFAAMPCQHKIQLLVHPTGLSPGHIRSSRYTLNLSPIYPV